MSGGIMKIQFKGKKSFLSLGLIALMVVTTSTAFSKIVTNVDPDISAKEIKAVVVEDFEQAGEWKAETTPKKFKGDAKKKDPVKTIELKFVEGSPADLKVEQWTADKKGMEKKQCLGVNFEFTYPGYNSVSIIPPAPIQLPGRAHGISIWVHGRGNNYYLETWVKDYKGNVHVLKFGSVNFVGWRPMEVEVPVFIPQETESYPQTKTLKIERFVLRSDPNEIITNTFFFFDQLKVLTETFEVQFDGTGLEKSFESMKNSESNGNTTDSTKPVQ
jgi:hypothetical protein